MGASYYSPRCGDSPAEDILSSMDEDCHEVESGPPIKQEAEQFGYSGTDIWLWEPLRQLCGSGGESFALTTDGEINPLTSEDCTFYEEAALGLEDSVYPGFDPAGVQNGSVLLPADDEFASGNTQTTEPSLDDDFSCTTQSGIEPLWLLPDNNPPMLVDELKELEKYPQTGWASGRCHKAITGDSGAYSCEQEPCMDQPIPRFLDPLCGGREISSESLEHTHTREVDGILSCVKSRNHWRYREGRNQFKITRKETKYYDGSRVKRSFPEPLFGYKPSLYWRTGHPRTQCCYPERQITPSATGVGW